MATQAEISSQILQALTVSEPDLDTTIGTTVRKLIDSVAQAIANADSAAALGITSYAIDSLSGSSLDDFVSTFGFQRFSAFRAVGTATFSVAAVSSSNVAIPVGSSIGTTGSPQVAFNTITAALIPAGQISVDVPIQAVLGGFNGNVAANTITQKISPLTGVAAVANLTATSGGTDAESDVSLRARFKATIFRGYTGTEQMFLGTALENVNVSQANVIGSSKTHNEQIQLQNGIGYSTVQDAKYIYDFNFAFGPDLASNDILTPEVSYDFSAVPAIFDPSQAPNALVGTGGILTPGTYTYQIAFGGTLGHLPTYTLPSPQVSVGVGQTQNAVTISWTSPSNAQRVYIFGIFPSGARLLADLPATDSSWQDIGAEYTSVVLPLPTANTTGYTVAIVSLDSVTCPSVGQVAGATGVYDLEFEYLPAASRNNPNSGVTNKVDLYVVGQDPKSATENVPFSQSMSFSSDPTSPLYYQRFVHPDSTNPTVGNIFLPLSFTPVTELPDTVVVGATTYTLGTDYFLVNDSTNLGYTLHSLSGMEWVNDSSIPTLGTLISVSYTYNAVPSEVETAIQQWRLVCCSAGLHEAQQALIDIYLVVVLAPGYASSTVQASLTTALQGVMSAVGFDGVLQTSSIIAAAAAVPGVSAVRLSTSLDAEIENSGGGYGIQQVAVSDINGVITTTLVENWAQNGRAIDAYFTDDTLPVLNSVILDVRSQNTLNQGA